MAAAITPRHLLIEARKLVESHAETYICLAIDTAAYACNCGHATADVARIAVSRMLNGEPFDCLEDWLIRNRHATSQQLDEYPDKVRVTRLAWIDWMLANHPTFKE